MLSQKTLAVLLPLFLAFSPSTIALPQAGGALSPSGTAAGASSKVLTSAPAASSGFDDLSFGDDPSVTSIDMPEMSGTPANDRYNQTYDDSSDAGWPSDNSTDFTSFGGDNSTDFDNGFNSTSFNSTGPYTTDRHSSFDDYGDSYGDDSYGADDSWGDDDGYSSYDGVLVNNTDPAVTNALQTLKKSLNISDDGVTLTINYDTIDINSDDWNKTTTLVTAVGQDPSTVVGAVMPDYNATDYSDSYDGYSYGYGSDNSTTSSPAGGSPAGSSPAGLTNGTNTSYGNGVLSS